MTTPSNLFHGRRYWLTAYQRRFTKVMYAPGVFCISIVLLLLMLLGGVGIEGGLLFFYWLVSLQLCYDDALNYRVYLGWAVIGVLVTWFAWDFVTTDPRFIITVMGATLIITLTRAYTARQRKCWGEWWSRFTYFQDQDQRGCRRLSTQELCVAFGLGSKRKVSPSQANTFLRAMETLGYVRPFQPIAYTQDVTWLELDPTQGDLVQPFLDRGVLPPPSNWLKDYVTKNKMPVSQPA